ncbi:type II toxin-antitoxin system PemK/MazF family toxin [Candidatus Riflebacteria bacterium]
MKRGDIWWANLEQPIGRRPVILLSRDEAYNLRKLITIALVTTRVRNLPVEIPLGKPEGLKKPSVMNPDYIVTIRKSCLVKKIGRIAKSKRKQMDEALKFSLGLDDD